MKYIHNKILICATLISLPCGLFAQAGADTVAMSDDSVYMVNTAFRKVAQDDLLTGVSVVNVEEMLNSNYTTYSLTNMVSLANGWNGSKIWGMDDYLVLVDGMPRGANNVMPSEIAQISFLKGANAVALYGSRAAKGVLLITTKRGCLSENLKIDGRVSVGFNVAKKLPEYLGAAEYMDYYNQASKNDNGGVDKPAFSDEEILTYYLVNKTSDSELKYRYPDIDFYSSDYIKKVYSTEDAVLEFSGGNKSARYYVNINAYTFGDYLKVGETKHDRTNRFSVRGNVDMDLNKYISAYIDANATFYDVNGRKGDYWADASTIRPNIQPNLKTNSALLVSVDMVSDSTSKALLSTSNNIYNGKFLAAANKAGANNVFAQIYAGGKTKWTSRQFQFDAGMRFDLGKLLDGLAFKASLGMDFQTEYTQEFNPEYAVFIPTWDSETEKITKLTKEGTELNNGQQSISNSTDNRTLAGNAAFEYNRQFGSHSISAMVLGNCFQQFRSGSYHAIANANLGFDLSYNFDRRYYAQFSAAEPYSANLAEGHRAAFSPTGTIGWRISNESFMENVSFIDNLLISASAGILNEDADIENYYMYNGSWDNTNGWSFTWNDGSHAKSLIPNRGENEKLEMIKRKELAATIKASMFDKLVNLEFTYFTNKMSGYIIDDKSDWPKHMDGFLPYLNNNEIKRTGFDFAVNLNKKINDFDVTFGVVGTYYNTERTVYEETQTEDYQRREGRPVDAVWGLECLGMFQSQEEIDNSPRQTFDQVVRPGDLKYKDQNGDGKITDLDNVYLGKWGEFGSPLTLGLNLVVKYKNFTLHALGSARSGSYGAKNSSYYWINKDSKYSIVARDTWTPENPNAKYPALTTTAGSNNYRISDFWLYKNNSFTFDKIQISYEVPSEVFGDLFIKGLTAYVSGSDLLTIAKERKHMEMSVGSAPQSRFFNIGVKANF
ncbi:MAG: SusC/RagA family TonB-linked outer membrane protein [Salinivirgaceae bacterium]|nr:SusC/RagA family TonB-linked outer membrane protein [Salinivirgaceae bacterium]